MSIFDIFKRKEDPQPIEKPEPVDPEISEVLTLHENRISTLEKNVMRLLGATGGRPKKQGSTLPIDDIAYETDTYLIKKDGRYIKK